MQAPRKACSSPASAQLNAAVRKARSDETSLGLRGRFWPGVLHLLFGPSHSLPQRQSWVLKGGRVELNRLMELIGN